MGTPTLPGCKETERFCWRRGRRWEGAVAGACHGLGQRFRAAPSSSVSSWKPHVPWPLFKIPFPKRLPGWRDHKKFTPPCHECSRSSGASGQKLLAISSGHDLCFDRGRGGLQSIKPSPGPGRGLRGQGGVFTRGRRHKDTALPLRFGEEEGRMPRCWLRWKLKL